MKKVIFLSLSIATLLILAVLTGCGSKSDVVATVNGDKITIDDVNDIFNRARWTFPTGEDEYQRRKEILDTLVITRLLVQAAYDKDIDKLDEIARVVLSNRDKFLLDALYNKYVASKSEPTEAEMKEFYDNLDFKYRASHILVSDLDTANALLDRIKNGENFEQLAYDYSIDPMAKRNRGDLGYFVWGAMVPEFQEAVIQMKPGEVSPPVKTKFGYHIIKLVDKLPNENKTDFESMKEDIKNSIRQAKITAITDAFFQDLKKKYPVTIDTTTCNYILHKRETIYPPQLLKSLPKNDFDMEHLDRDEKELIIATMEGSQMTINEYLTQIRSVPTQYRPDFDDYDSLASVIFEMKKMDLLTLEAVREGLDNDPDYLKKMKLFKELNMADIMRNDSIPTPPDPSEDEVREYYDTHVDEFTTPSKVHVFEILLSDELKARKLASQIKSLKDFKNQAEDLTERSGYRSKSGDLGYIERSWYPAIFDLAKKTAIGEIGGPVVTNQKYSIFYVVDKMEPQLKDFLGVKRQIIETLKRKIKDEAFQKWVEEKEKDSDISINDDLLWSSIDMTKYQTVNDTTKN